MVVPALLILFPISQTAGGLPISRVYRWTPETGTVEFGLDLLPGVMIGDVVTPPRRGYFVEGILDEVAVFDLVSFAEAVQKHAFSTGLFLDR